MGGGAGGGVPLKYTPTWVVALVGSIIVAISLLVERILHFAGKYLLKKKQISLFRALRKIREELMLLGFLSLLLEVFQDRIGKICIPKNLTNHWLPCKKDQKGTKSTPPLAAPSPAPPFFLPGSCHLLAAASNDGGSRDAKGKAPLLSPTALHDLHIFIFVLAVSHVVFSALIILFGGLTIQQWRKWEDSIQKNEYDPEEATKNKITCVQDHAFIRSRFSGVGRVALFSWLKSFLKQFYGSVTKSDYTTLRLGFVMKHCRSNPKFNFYKYMTRALEKDLKKVVGISWYLWVFVVILLLLNVYGWHAYFWISFVPLIVLLAVGTKLEHVIAQLADEVAEKHMAVIGDLVVKPSDDHFWFHRPRLVLVSLHVTLFQNAFQIAVFFWMLVKFGFESCIGEVGFIIPRLVIGVFVQVLCSYSTLPLYAIVTQMGSSFSKEIFEEHIQAGLLDWAQRAKNKGLKKAADDPSNPQQSEEMTDISAQAPVVEQGKNHVP